MIMNMVGGGGASLNFKIVSGTVQPENPRENTIWINTDTEITCWSLSATEPQSPTAGMVWIETGGQGGIAINALKKNSIQISLLTASQHISGAWVEKPAQIYQGGEWKGWIDWGKWIVKDGLYKLPMAAEGKKYDSSYASGTTFTVTEGDGYILFSHGYHTGMVYWGAVDLTDVTKLVIEGEFNMASGQESYYALTVWKTIGSTITAGRVLKTELSKTGATLDVSSLTGEHYVGFTVREYGSEKVTNFWRE